MCVAVLKYEWKKRWQPFFVGVLQGRDVDINEENGFYCCAEQALLWCGTCCLTSRIVPFRGAEKPVPRHNEILSDE